VLVIPPLIDINGPWKVLPPGVVDASMDEVKLQYATNSHRERLFEGLTKTVAQLKAAGCTAIFLDGSFVGENPNPGDFDVCYVPLGMDPKKLDPVLLDMTKKGREAQKRKYGGEHFPSLGFAAPGQRFFDYFQKDKSTGKRKGIIRLH
jgi:hypothetical protein